MTGPACGPWPNWRKRHGALLLCDEVYEYLLYEGEHYSPASEYDNVVTVNSFSKSLRHDRLALGIRHRPRGTSWMA